MDFNAILDTIMGLIAGTPLEGIITTIVDLIGSLIGG